MRLEIGRPAVSLRNWPALTVDGRRGCVKPKTRLATLTLDAFALSVSSST